MNVIEALLLGLLQGLTEFLPISSSGHLAIGKHLLHLNENVLNNPTFEIVVHIATALSVIVTFRKVIADLLGGAFRFEWNTQTQYLARIAVATLPIAVVGVFFKEKAERLFAAGLPLVGAMLLLTALLLAFTHLYRPKRRRPISLIDALIIGLTQAVAILPGLSRSGSTIAAALLLGNERSEAARFSFLIVLIPILGEAVLGAAGGDFAAAAEGIGVVPLAVGFAAAFAAGTATCKFMVAFVQRSSLLGFAIYCAIVGAAALIMTAV